MCLNKDARPSSDHYDAASPTLPSSPDDSSSDDSDYITDEEDSASNDVGKYKSNIDNKPHPYKFFKCFRSLIRWQRLILRGR